MMESKNKIANSGTNGSLILAGATTIFTANAMASYIPFNNAKEYMVALGAICIATDCYNIVQGSNKYKKLFQGLGLKNKLDHYPYFKEKQKTGTGYKLLFTLPKGLSSYDFEDNIEAIKQTLDVDNLSICYANHNVILEVKEQKLEKEYPFELTTSKFKLPIIAGYSLKGINIVDLSSGEPHMLIAGESGSGKSTLLRAILTNLICTTNIQLHLVDLKHGAEFQIFEKCSNVKSFSRTKEDAEKVLYNLNIEIDRRYDLFYKSNCVDISEYNKKHKSSKLTRKLLVVDEFSDLQGEKKSTKILETLSAKARACGIHMILATQRPDSKVLNGRIKANIPRVVGLKCNNGTNSRIIIDRNGLEDLRGRGHGILISSGKEIEIQAMNITPSQARDLVKSKYKKENDTKIDNGKTYNVSATRVEKQGEVKELDFLDRL